MSSFLISQTISESRSFNSSLTSWNYNKPDTITKKVALREILQTFLASNTCVFHGNCVRFGTESAMTSLESREFKGTASLQTAEYKGYLTSVVKHVENIWYLFYFLNDSVVL